MSKRLCLVVLLCVVAGCGGSTSATSSSSGGGSNGGGTTTTDAGLRFTATGDFTASASANISALLRATTAQCADLETPITFDNPVLTDGLDCDGDGGLVMHVTPTNYAIAFKRVALLTDDEASDIDFVADTGTLADSEVISFTDGADAQNVVTIEPGDLAAGTYSGIEVEIYYFQMTFPVAGVTRNVRIYMSDDDFATEGNLGHHQGDITFIDDDGTELGWVDSTWGDSLAASRGEAQNGAGGVDAETGHDRGFFGDSTLWNASDQNQGDSQDVYLAQLPFADPLIIPDPTTITDLTTVTATFSIADTFYYEDFAPQGTGFFPGVGGEATSEGAEWAPLVPTADLSVTTTDS